VRAEEILDRKKPQPTALSDKLFEQGYVEGTALNTTLGK